MPTYHFTCETCNRERKAWRTEEQGPPRFCTNACKNEGMIGIALKPAKYTVSPLQSEQIRKAYLESTGSGEISALAKRLHLPRWKVTRHAQRNGWIATGKKSPPWTEAEEKTLQHFSRYCLEKIQIRMAEAGHPKRTIAAYALKMKRLRCRSNLEGHSARSVAECLGVDVHFVTRAINTGKLKAKKRGTARVEEQGGDMWFIREWDIRDYIVENVNEIDFRKVDKHWMVDLLVNCKYETESKAA